MPRDTGASSSERSAPSYFAAVYSGSTLADFTERSCIYFQNSANTGPLADGAYRVQVGGLYGQAGWGSLSFP